MQDDDDESESTRGAHANLLRQVCALLEGIDDDEAADIRARVMATAAGMPRICTLKRCRRRKRCFGEPPRCLMNNLGLMHQRLAAAYRTLGWNDPGGKHGRSQLQLIERAWRRQRDRDA
jgi:uncharacterized protein YecT (DUF1311 family)